MVFIQTLLQTRVKQGPQRRSPSQEPDFIISDPLDRARFKRLDLAKSDEIQKGFAFGITLPVREIFCANSR